MRKYLVSAKGYEVEVKAAGFHTAIARALRVLRNSGDYKDSDRVLNVTVINLGEVPEVPKEAS